MKIQIRVLLFSLIIILVSTSLVSFPVQGRSVALDVARVVWGEDPDSPIKAYPGDSEVQLTIEVQNLSPDRIIKGVSGTLFFEEGPFTDIYGNHNVTSIGEPTIGDILESSDEIGPKGFFTLAYTLEVDEDAVPGAYSYSLIVEYSLEDVPGYNQTRFVEGTPQSLIIKLIVSKIESSIEVSVSPEITEIGESVRISGSIDPFRENATVTFSFTRPNGTSFHSNTTINVDGTFAYNMQTDTSGFWSVNTSWVGDDKYKGDWSASSFEARLPVDIRSVISNKRITGGVDNQVNITIQNFGEVAVSALEMSLEIPEPLVILGRTLWSLNYLEAGRSAFIVFDVYAPANAIGSTYSGSLDISYRDDYDETHEDSIPVGLIVVGRIEMVLSEKTFEPQLVRNGSKVEVTMTLLNKGNTAAMYVNASIVKNSVLRLTKESSAYIGEVEDNAPTPFTLVAYVKNNVQNGTYPVEVQISFRDDQYNDRLLHEIINISITSLQENEEVSNTEDILRSLIDSWLVLLTAAIVSAIVMLLYHDRTIKKRKRNLENQVEDFR